MREEYAQLQKDMQQATRAMTSTQPDVAKQLRDAAGHAQQNEIENRMQQSESLIRQGMGSFAVMREAPVTQGLNQLKDDLKNAQQMAAAGNKGGDPTQQAQEGHRQIESLRPQLQALAQGDQARAAGRSGNQQGQRGGQHNGHSRGSNRVDSNRVDSNQADSNRAAATGRTARAATGQPAGPGSAARRQGQQVASKGPAGRRASRRVISRAAAAVLRAAASPAVCREGGQFANGGDYNGGISATRGSPARQHQSRQFARNPHPGSGASRSITRWCGSSASFGPTSRATLSSLASIRIWSTVRRVSIRPNGVRRIPNWPSELPARHSPSSTNWNFCCGESRWSRWQRP